MPRTKVGLTIPSSRDLSRIRSGAPWEFLYRNAFKRILRLSRFMDFFAHLLWSGIIFADTNIYLGFLCGTLPDIVAFVPDFFRPRQPNVNWRTPEGRQSILSSPEYKRSLRVYSWTHSLVVWGIAIAIGALIWSFVGGEFPWFLLAGVIHVCIDIPTHSLEFFAPAFLTPISKYRFDGYSWANKKFMIINYALIVTFLLLRLIQYNFI